YKEENKGPEKREKEFLPIHNFFLLRFLMCPVVTPRNFIARPPANVDLKFSGRGTSAGWLPVQSRLLRIRRPTTGLTAGVNDNQSAIANRQSKINLPSCRPPK